MRDERRYKSREQQLFEQMEDLLDDERIRKKIIELEEAAAATKKSKHAALARAHTLEIGNHFASNFAA